MLNEMMRAWGKGKFMSKRDENILLGLAFLPWWVSVCFAVVVYVGLRFIVPAMFAANPFLRGIGPIFSNLAIFVAGIFLIPAVFSYLASGLASRLMHKLFDRQSDTASISSLSWRQFEELVGEYYRRQSYAVEQVGGDNPDGGIDLIARKDGSKIVVQCKHWKAFKVDVKIVRELYGVMVDEAASGAVIVISGEFTQPAIDFARGKPIELVDGPKLAEMIEAVKAAETHALPSATRPAAPVPAPPKKRDDRAYMPPEMRAELEAAEARPQNLEAQPAPAQAERRDDRRFMPPAIRAQLETEEPDFADEHPVCPYCKTRMVLRSAKRGANAGSKFWGCSSYPRCQYTTAAS